MAGCLYLISTPIGNLGDVSYRAAEILAACDIVACENIRKTRRLLNHLGISKKAVKYYERNELKQSLLLAEEIQSGQSIALVSEAGTPGISDPGFRIVRELPKEKLPVFPIPGTSAVLAATSASGLPSDGFLFVGFLPSKKSARIKFFEKHRDFEYTIVFFESCYRIEKFLDDLITVLGNGRIICVAREMTKIHETFYVGSAGEVQCQVVSDSRKGEYVVLIAKKDYEL